MSAQAAASAATERVFLIRVAATVSSGIQPHHEGPRERQDRVLERRRKDLPRLRTARTRLPLRRRVRGGGARPSGRETADGARRPRRQDRDRRFRAAQQRGVPARSGQGLEESVRHRRHRDRGRRGAARGSARPRARRAHRERIWRQGLMPAPLRLAFLGCGFITRVHSRHLRSLRPDVTCAYASRDHGRAEAYRARYAGFASFGDYSAAIADPRVDAVVIAVPPRFHLALASEALAAGKHVLVEKPAFPRMADYEAAVAARDAAGRVVIVGETDHYKPLAVRLRALLAEGAIGDMVFAQFTTIAHRLKTADDWRNDEAMAGGDAFFEEGIHWLHMAGSLGPAITSVQGYRPAASHDGADRRAKSMMIAFRYDNDAVGALFYSREIPSLFRGLRVSKLYGREGVITFESNGLALLARGRGLPRLIFPGFTDIRGYKAMYRDFARAIAGGGPPAMSLERAMDDQRLMDQVYATL